MSTTALAYNPNDPNLAREGAQKPQDPLSATVELFAQVMSFNNTASAPTPQPSTSYSAKSSSPSLTQVTTDSGTAPSTQGDDVAQ